MTISSPWWGLLGWFGKALTAREELTAGELGGLGRLWEPVDVERALDCYRAALAAGSRAPRRRPCGSIWQGGRSGSPDGTRRASLWEEAARDTAFDPRPWEELAKFHEHRRRDFAAAHAVVEDALGLAEDTSVSSRVRGGVRLPPRPPRAPASRAADGRGGFAAS